MTAKVILASPPVSTTTQPESNSRGSPGLQADIDNNINRRKQVIDRHEPQPRRSSRKKTGSEHVNPDEVTKFGPPVSSRKIKSIKAVVKASTTPGTSKNGENDVEFAGGGRGEKRKVAEGVEDSGPTKKKKVF